MEEVQRTRILEAMADAISARGADAGSVTLAEVLARCGVSGAVFHQLFADREDCLAAAFEFALARARVPVLAAYEPEPRWLDAIRGALAALLRFLEREPSLGRLLVVHSTSCGEWVMRRRIEVQAALAEAIDHGRHEGAPGRREPSPVIAEGVVGAVLTVLQNRLLADRRPALVELYGSLVSIVVLPYLGAGVAHRELTRPVPPERPLVKSASGVADGAPRDASVRLTYRTVRVLTALAEYPGASNSEVGERAGIVDQGQISRLLGRLHARGLIVKLGAKRSARGAPNSWGLSARGEELLAGVRASRA